MNAFNFITMAEYNGKNALLEGNGALPAFASFNQLKDNGYQVKKGAKSVHIFCGYRETKDGERVPRWGRVFDICDTTASDDKAFLAHVAAEIKAGKLKTPQIA